MEVTSQPLPTATLQIRDPGGCQSWSGIVTWHCCTEKAIPSSYHNLFRHIVGLESTTSQEPRWLERRYACSRRRFRAPRWYTTSLIFGSAKLNLTSIRCLQRQVSREINAGVWGSLIYTTCSSSAHSYRAGLFLSFLYALSSTEPSNTVDWGRTCQRSNPICGRGPPLHSLLRKCQDRQVRSVSRYVVFFVWPYFSSIHFSSLLPQTSQIRLVSLLPAASSTMPTPKFAKERVQGVQIYRPFGESSNLSMSTHAYQWSLG